MPFFQSRDSLKTFAALTVGNKAYAYYSLKAAEQTLGDLSRLPFSLRILLENQLRHEDDAVVSLEDMRTVAAFHALRKNPPPLAFRPARLLMKESAAVSVLSDLAALRQAQIVEKDDPSLLSLTCPTDVMTSFGSERNNQAKAERMAFLRWGRQAFENFRLISTDKGQTNVLNAEHLARIVAEEEGREMEPPFAFPDTVLGESASLLRAGALGMLVLPANALDLEAVLLGSSFSFTPPSLLGIKIVGKRPKSVESTDIALSILKAVRQNGGSGKMLEFCGPGLDVLSVPDRLVIADFLGEAAPFSLLFPIDALTVAHLTRVGADPEHIALVEAYAKAQGLWRESWPQDTQQELSFSSVFEFDLGSLHQGLGGPGKALNPVRLSEAGATFLSSSPSQEKERDPLAIAQHGDVVWASLGPSGAALHPEEMALAGLLARKARLRGLTIKPWVRAVLDVNHPALDAFLSQTGLAADFEAIGFCRRDRTEAPLPSLQEAVTEELRKKKITVCGIGTVPPTAEAPFPEPCGAQYVASPALIVLYSLLGSMRENPTLFLREKIKENWPKPDEIAALLQTAPLAPLYEKHGQLLREDDAAWKDLPFETGPVFPWPGSSFFLKKPSFLDSFKMSPPPLENIVDGKILAIFGADVPARILSAPTGPVAPDSPVARFLEERSPSPSSFLWEDFSGNEELMLRGSFQETELKNLLPTASSETLADRAARLRREGAPLFLVAGANYGHGDVGQEWAVKATRLLGIRAVIAESYGPAHRQNLIRVGILPLQLKGGISVEDLKFDGIETLSVAGIKDFLRPPAEVMLTINRPESIERYMLLCRFDTEEEMETWRHGSLWAETLRNLIMLAA